VKQYPIPLNCIDRIYLSPWMSEAIADEVKATLKQIDGVRGIPITRSTLIRNDDWQKYGEAIVSQ
jgi:hypothetical protein